MMTAEQSQPASLVVFSDDWGRHPSSCQHLVRRLLPSYRVLWVNTIGTRAPRLNLATLRRVKEKVRHWSMSGPRPDDQDGSHLHLNLRVVNPRMWPWFSRPYDRRLNAWLLQRQLSPLIRQLPKPVTALTTLPITADLVGRLPVEKWLYYCVDDFAEWPGLDGSMLRLMDVQMIRGADELVAVSQHLQRFIAAQGRPSRLLTHGVDLDHWETTADVPAADDLVPGEFNGPVVVFWGVVDRRLNVDMLLALCRHMADGMVVLVGPQQDPDDRLRKCPNLKLVGPRPFDKLPAIAARADVLVMPYADLPVTRAMQPLKMKEYLATGRPVVVSALPATAAWKDCMDICHCPDSFTSAVLQRIAGGVPAEQQVARLRLKQESWASKARELTKTLVVPETQAAEESS